MADIDYLVRENVKRLKPYSCARDEFSGKAAAFLDANENPYGSLNRYPDPLQKELKNRIAEIKGTDPGNIFLGNGSDEVIDLCYRTFCNPGSDKALVLVPTYGMYEVAAGVNDAEVVKVPLDDAFMIDTAKTLEAANLHSPKLIFICSPNNPTGNTMQREAVEAVIARPGSIVVVDEAYIDFSPHPSLMPLLKKYENLVIMQTFSKAYGLAGARVGMAFASESIINYFNKLKYPYNISVINQEAVLKKLSSGKPVNREAGLIVRERMRLAEHIASLAITEHVFHSDSNFILVRFSDPGKVFGFLLDRGIVTRNRSSVVKGCIRITTGTRKENDMLLKTLNEIK